MERVLLLPGDGQGPDAVAATRAAITAAADGVEVVMGDIGVPAYERYGEALPYETLDQVGGCPVVICGPTAGEGRGPLGRLMSQLDLFARCRRFATLADGMGTPGMDVAVWGTNANAEKDVSETRDVDGITISKYIRADFYARMMGAAISDMELSGRTRAVCVAREGVFPESSAMIYDTFDALFDRDGIESSHASIDGWVSDFVADPASYGMLVVSDLYLTVAERIAAAFAGGERLSPVKYVGDSKTLILPCGEDDPREPRAVAGILSAAIALEDLGMRDEADRIAGALRATLAAGELPAEAGGDLGPEEFARRVTSRI